MKSKIFLILSLLSFYYSTCISTPMLEAEKTWWYESGICEDKSSVSHTPVTLGLILMEPESSNPNLYPCFAIDSNKNNILDIPIAHLREDNGKIWVIPNPKLIDIDLTDCSNELEILSTFLGFWRVTDLYLYFVNYTEDLYGWWKLELDTHEYLLYDFNFEVGNSYRWPWSQIDYINKAKFNYDEKYASNIEKRDFIITKVDTIRNDETGDQKAFKITQTGVSLVSDNRKPITIIERIGITDGDFATEWSGYTSWFGFFISPASPALSDLSGGWYSLPFIPKLKAVITKDGTHIYGDPSYNPSAKITKPKVDTIEKNRIFNLHGRPVSTPLPGSVYIRDGKKYICK